MESVPVVNTVITLPHVIVESIPLHVNAGNINLAAYISQLEFLGLPQFLQPPELPFTVAKYRKVVLNIMELQKESTPSLRLPQGLLFFPHLKGRGGRWLHKCVLKAVSGAHIILDLDYVAAQRLELPLLMLPSQ